MVVKSGPECLIPKPPNRPGDTMILLVNFKSDSEHGWVLLSAEAYQQAKGILYTLLLAWAQGL